MNYYTYAYLREDGTPYYIGKGRKNRINNQHVNVPVPPKDRRVYLKQGLSEIDAYRHEMYLIDVLGRKDLGTGMLINRSPGGEGNSGPRPSMKGKNNPRYGKPSTIRGKIWVNNGLDHKMVFEDEIPDGWVNGRLNVQENKEQFRQQGLNNNPNAKHYRIVFIDGSEVECYQLSKWARENNISYGICKAILRQTRYNKRKYIKKNASTNIKSIHEVTTELLTSN